MCYLHGNSPGSLSRGKRTLTKSSLDKDLKKVVRLETATHEISRSFAPMGLGLLFLIAVLAFTTATITDTPTT